MGKAWVVPKYLVCRDNNSNKMKNNSNTKRPKKIYSILKYDENSGIDKKK